MTYAPSYYQPSLLELARQGNFRAIAYWMNSIFAPHGIHVQSNSARSGRLMLLVNFPHATHPQACLKTRQRLVRYICYRLWTLNSQAIQDVQITARISGQRDVIWRQTVRIHAPATAPQSLRRKAQTVPVRKKSRTLQPDNFQLLRSFLLPRLAIVGFLFCYWAIYLEMTGQQTAEQPSVAAIPPQQMQPQVEMGQEKTTIAHNRSQAQTNTFTVPQQFQGQIVYEATPPADAEKVVALTFDDGPWKQTTEQILEILQKNNIKSTFYFVGNAIQENPEIARKVFEQGHAIGNHTWKHPMEDLDVTTAAQELGNAARLIYQATGGVRTYLMRPPGGNLSGELANYAKHQGYMVTMWSADSHDYYVSAPLIVDNVLSQVKPGGIVLMHDGGGDRSATVEALPQIISALQRQGYKFVTIPQLMELQAKWSTQQPASTPSLNSPPAVAPSTLTSPPPATEGDTGSNQPSPAQPLQPLPDRPPTNFIQDSSPTPIFPNGNTVPVNSVPGIQDRATLPHSSLMQEAEAIPVDPETVTAFGYAR